MARRKDTRVVLWNPPLTKAAQKPGRQRTQLVARAAENGCRSTNIETATLLATLVRANVKHSSPAPGGAELVLRYTREALEMATPTWRSVAFGHTMDDRRRLSRRLWTANCWAWSHKPLSWASISAAWMR